MALQGIRVIEFAGLAPVPYAGLVLADWGASVTRIDRSSSKGIAAPIDDVLTRNKRSIALDISTPAGLEVAKKLIAQADVLLDPFRPGVLERLGLGPEVFLGKEVGGQREKGLNGRLVYARIAGYEPSGPQRDHAGHDLNYLAASGVLDTLPKLTDGTPSFPLNIVADFAGGGLMCAMGVMVALLERERNSGRGQVVSTDMVSGARYVSTFPLHHAALPGAFIPLLIGGGAPFYTVYNCKDGKQISVACLEPRFFQVFLQTFKQNLPRTFSFKSKLTDEGDNFPQPHHQMQQKVWPEMRRYLREGFTTKTRDEWGTVFDGAKDACVFPVLSPAEADARRNEHGAQPHPLLSRTPALSLASSISSVPLPKHGLGLLTPGQHSLDVLREFGFNDRGIEELVRDRAVRVAGTGGVGARL